MRLMSGFSPVSGRLLSKVVRAWGFMVMKWEMLVKVPPRSYHVRPDAEYDCHRSQLLRDVYDFLEAIDSYPGEIKKHPRLSFRQHLCGIIVRRSFRGRERAGARLRRE